ncbi:MAG: hypothetical protein RIC82_05970, partial [Parvibaculum sp.]
MMGRRPSKIHSKAAIRQKRYRERQDRNVFVWPVEVSEDLKDALVKLGHIEKDDVENPDDLSAALGWLLEKVARDQKKSVTRNEPNFKSARIDPASQNGGQDMKQTALDITFDPETQCAMAPIALSKWTLKRFEDCGFVREGDKRNVIALGERLTVILRELGEELEQYNAG